MSYRPNSTHTYIRTYTRTSSIETKTPPHSPTKTQAILSSNSILVTKSNKSSLPRHSLVKILTSYHHQTTPYSID
ncbi:hypothetical protein K445DRAFT_313605 [Daldinia sp. EC12]|nr:hypothetical protein K445DRAFT_313605 [Daldinia sp. EC12]